MHAESQIVDRDDHYIKYANGVVYDSKIGLEWIAGPGRNMSWDEAKEWAKGLDIDGSGWGMPTRKELETLYQEGKGKRNMTRLLETEAWWIWSVEPDDSLSSVSLISAIEPETGIPEPQEPMQCVSGNDRFRAFGRKL